VGLKAKKVIFKIPLFRISHLKRSRLIEVKKHVSVVS